MSESKNSDCSTTNSPCMSATASLPSFEAPYAEKDELLAASLLAGASLDAKAEARIDRLATRLITATRAHHPHIGGIEDLLREYSLSSEEGLALMVLAESLLRVPDDLTADQLIEDKLGSGDTRKIRKRCWFLPRPGRLGFRPACSARDERRKASRPALPIGSARGRCGPPREHPCRSWARISSSARRSRKLSRASSNETPLASPNPDQEPTSHFRPG